MGKKVASSVGQRFSNGAGKMDVARLFAFTEECAIRWVAHCADMRALDDQRCSLRNCASLCSVATVSRLAANIDSRQCGISHRGL